ncbi:MAG TPA: divalent-cation tolerance protein CutA [Terriglobales bacterium]|nr:divalent-cation tolerance protein CutA [Terriglobales bacterium]
MEVMIDYCIVLTTAGSGEEAERIAAAMVGARLAACVNIVSPITSFYRWKDAVQKEQEWLLLIKTRATLFEDICGRIRELHSYELPECIQIPIANGGADYLNWIAENSKAKNEKR